ncbi:uncharacterized protein LOC121377100 [Gigantopelta aegis]|uniref:uncharacterized protein LOC121377100 n=1 Tax=Gigantopelta aegis TaxID=1735272 RepID=UPI001B88E71A|nr:uncharacterized protein LOC121377100 [Gigantopelta aegis]
MDTNSIWVYVFVVSSFFVSCAGVSLNLTASTIIPRKHQEVTLTCIFDDPPRASYTVYIRQIYGFSSYRQIAYFRQTTSVCSTYAYDLFGILETTGTLCGSGTNTANSKSKEYVATITLIVGEMTDYLCTSNYNRKYYYSNFVNLRTINKVECASLNISGGGDVLTVTEGKQYDGFTCSTGDANLELEVRLKLNDTSSTDLSVRKLKSAARIERRPTFCSHLANEQANTFITSISLAYVPERRHDGNYVYCSARNSEMGTSEEVTSNKIRLIVQFGPLEQEMSFNTDEVFYTVAESDSLTITCSVDCNPTCTYIWTYLDRGIATGSRLSLIHITEQEAGYYKCSARNPGSGITADKYFKLRVESSSFTVGAAAGIGVAVGVVVTSVVAVVTCLLVRRGIKCSRRKNTGVEKHTYANTGMQNLASREYKIFKPKIYLYSVF